MATDPEAITESQVNHVVGGDGHNNRNLTESRQQSDFDRHAVDGDEDQLGQRPTNFDLELNAIKETLESRIAEARSETEAKVDGLLPVRKCLS